MKYVALTLSAVATVLLASAVAGIAHQIGSNKRQLLPPQNALQAISPQKLRDQADVNEALLALGKVSPARFLAPGGADNQASGQAAAGTYLSDRELMAQNGNIFALAGPRVETPVHSPRRAIASSAPVRSLPLPRVSVVLQSGADGKAVIDGNLVRVGDPVGDGFLVKSIQIDAVTFAAGKEEVEVRMPLGRLRVLGAYPQAHQANR